MADRASLARRIAVVAGAAALVIALGVRSMLEVNPQAPRSPNILLIVTDDQTLGTWRAIAADEAAGTAGTLQGWSLIVTPRSFTCTALAPTAAHVRISGRVVDVEGRGLGNVLLTLTDSAGHVATARANAFGYFEFDDVEAGQTYLLAAQAKRYSFSPQVLSVQDDVVDLVLTAE